jgi:hypothetical protein
MASAASSTMPTATLPAVFKPDGLGAAFGLRVAAARAATLVLDALVGRGLGSERLAARFAGLFAAVLLLFAFFALAFFATGSSSKLGTCELDAIRSGKRRG